MDGTTMLTLARKTILALLIGVTPMGGLEQVIAQTQHEEASETEEEEPTEEQVKHDHSETFYTKTYTAENILELEKELKAHPTSRGYVRLSDLNFDNNDVPRAKKASENAIKIDPTNWEGYHNLGTSLSRLGKYEEALKQLEKAMKLAPGRPEPYYGCGVVEGKRRRYSSALHFYKKALQVDPNDSLSKEAIKEINDKLHIY